MDDLHAGLQEQARSGGLLGDILVRLGIVPDTAIVEAISDQTGVAALGTLPVEIPREVTALLPRELCVRLRLVPLRAEQVVLQIAMANPFDLAALEAVKLSCGLMPVASMATWNEIQQAIERSYGPAAPR